MYQSAKIVERMNPKRDSRLWIIWNIVIGLSVKLELAQAAYSPAKETEIRNETVLSSSYDPVSRPQAMTHIKAGLNILAIDELNLKGQKLTMAGWLTFNLSKEMKTIKSEWEDDRIVWDKAAKDDIEYIFTQPKYIWKPEVVIDNAIANLGAIKTDDLLIRVTSTGEVLWVPPTMFATHCQVHLWMLFIRASGSSVLPGISQCIRTYPLDNLDILSNDALLLRLKYDGTVDWEPPLLFVTHCQVDVTFYPYDQQKCAVEIVSWTYTIEEVKLDHLFEEVNLEDFEIHGEWDITHTEIEDKNLTEHLPDGTVRIFPQLDFWLYLERRTDFYNLNVMLPIILTSLMVVLVFIVPVDSGEKVSYVLTVFLALAVLLTIVANSLPPTSITVSVLGLYLGIVLILAAFGILLTVCILILFHKGGKPEKHTFIITVAVWAAKMICWRSATMRIPNKDSVTPINLSDKMDTCSVVTSDFQTDVKTERKGKPKSLKKLERTLSLVDDKNEITWKSIALILDRFCFYFFLIITVLMNFSFVLALATGGR